uniref:Uncharacterized protein n=1 Tax=Setaria italica TaxID=4555 RepID=K4AP45_SETIT
MQSFFDREKKNPKWTSRKNLGNFVSHVQSRLFKADSKHHIAKSFGRQKLLLSCLERLPCLFLLKKGQLSRWPSLVQQISISFIRGSELRSGWFGSFFASWFLGTFLMVSVIPPILPGHVLHMPSFSYHQPS